MPPALHILTGATGLVGSALALELATRDDQARLLCLVRSPEPDATAQLHAQLRACAHAYDLPARALDAVLARTQVQAGIDLSHPHALLLPDVPAPRAGAVHFWHSAARMYFRESERRAQFASNTAGTRRALTLAARMGAGDFTMISTAYVAGTSHGTVLEQPADGTLCRNPYERSKLAAERAVLAARGKFAVRILRPSIITGHSITRRYPGRTTGAYTAQRIINAFHRAMPAHARTQQRRVLAEPAAPLNLVPIDRVAAEAADIALRAGSEGIYHLTDPTPPSVQDFLNACFTNAAAPPPTCVQDTGALDDRDRILHTMLAPYTPYLTVRQDFDRHRTDSAVPRPRAYGPSLDAPGLLQLLQPAPPATT
ncbi:male sterility protein [Kitasatospora sp. SolWspMP-SS2h]|uniref:SDR family oxidoreductase n=1 Tax=Kitasatospora sp. SolWspMP-SS2h TaxID=1305729 RepID=UPI000DB9CAE5|nr:SDR family oxidoreductase [Kitasatospora sp. SolWspMP-SS2h]RAJ31783.1 male sterility protein [Kitasatospora sp. SolWspMP-SS2h]